MTTQQSSALQDEAEELRGRGDGASQATEAENPSGALLNRPSSRNEEYQQPGPSQPVMQDVNPIDQGPATHDPATSNSDKIPLPDMRRANTTGSSRPYSSFSMGTKWLIVVVGGIAAIFSPISVSLTTQ
jgi:hypothetical protein